MRYGSRVCETEVRGGGLLSSLSSLSFNPLHEAGDRLPPAEEQAPALPFKGGAPDYKLPLPEYPSLSFLYLPS